MSRSDVVKPGETLTLQVGRVKVSVSLNVTGQRPEVKVSHNERVLMDWSIDPKFLEISPNDELSPPLIGVFSNDT